MASDDLRYMRRALELAARGAGETNPNPLVGCVVVRGGRIVGEGHHQRAGGPHAEVVALSAAGARARGATLYVTLEPCAHHGRTPPCAEAITAAGIARVVAATRDPNPAVDGRGLATLRRAGIRATAAGPLGAEARALNAPFIAAARRRRPFVLLKAGLTLDARIATARGRSKWITSPGQRGAARRLRRRFDGVLIGIGTAIADDPLLLPWPRTGRTFHRFVLDAALRLPIASRLVRSVRPRWPLWVFCHNPEPFRRRRLEARGVTVIDGPRQDGRIPVAWVLAELWRRGIWSVMIEGGSEVLGSFLAARAFDEVALFRAPLLLGGRGSLPAFGGPDPSTLEDAVRVVRAPSSEEFELWRPKAQQGKTATQRAQRAQRDTEK